MKLYNFIKEQMLLEFTGVVQVLKGPMNTLVGYIYLRDGVIVGTKYNSGESYRDLSKFLYDSTDKEWSFNIELSNYLNSDNDINIDKESFEELWSSINNKNYQQIPPGNVRIAVNTEFLKNSNSLTIKEFDVLSSIVDNSKIKYVYKDCNLPEKEVTEELISLRKRRAIKVI